MARKFVFTGVIEVEDDTTTLEGLREWLKQAADIQLDHVTYANPHDIEDARIDWDTLLEQS